LHHTFKNQSQKAKSKNPKAKNKKGMAHKIPLGISWKSRDPWPKSEIKIQKRKAAREASAGGSR
jgi:hypothetical protein